MRISVCVQSPKQGVYIYIWAHICTYISAHIYIYIFTHKHDFICMRTRINVLHNAAWAASETGFQCSLKSRGHLQVRRLGAQVLLIEIEIETEIEIEAGCESVVSAGKVDFSVFPVHAV